MSVLRSRLGEIKRGGSIGESGQVIVIVALILVVLLGMAGMVIDVGYAYYAQRSIQASADAAALAGAQELPDAGKAQALAAQYSASRGKKNARVNLTDVRTSVTTKCLTSAPGCDPVNAVVVDETAKVDTLFARLVGVNSFTVHIRATACSPCGTRPLDIMLVLDRTGSMCQDHYGNYDSSCTDLNNARNGMKTFLGYMDPTVDWVGLAVLPPATSLGNRCATPDTANYNSTASPYVIVPLSKDYKVNNRVNTSSNLISTINCQRGGGRTSYATAIEKAQAELDTHGRGDVQDVIIFLSDGAANIGPTYYPTNSPYRTQPCHQGVNSAAAQKAKKTLIYSIGYDLNADNGGANVCTSYTGALERPSITAYSALQQIATDAGSFYNQPTPGQLNTIFTQIAEDVSRGYARLVDNNTR